MTKVMTKMRPTSVVIVAVLAAAASLYRMPARAQAAPTDPAAAPAATTPDAPAPMPAPVVEPAPEPVAPPAPMPPPSVPVVVPAEAAPPPAPPSEDMMHAPMGIHAWGRVSGRLQSVTNPKKIDHLTEDGDLELHFDGNVTKQIGVTGNVAATYPGTNADGSTDPDGTVEILDLIGRFELADPFNVWVGRMLVPSDRANFSGTWFASPWYYAGTFSPNGFIGPHEGPYGRNDGLTIWGQAAGGVFKYYVGAFDLEDKGKSPLWTSRLNLSLINPEPGYYHSSTYYGSKDILAIAIGGQAQKAGSATSGTATTPALTDTYYEFNADVLFEKNLNGSGVFTLEGAVYDYVGQYEPFKFSWLGLVSYLSPEKVGAGKLQPLVRVQQAKVRSNEKMDTSLEAQIGYVIEEYNARLALGYQYTKTYKSAAGAAGNALYLGFQILK